MTTRNLPPRTIMTLSDTRLVTWDKNRASGPAFGAPEVGATCKGTLDNDLDLSVNDGCTSTIIIHDGVSWGFSIWPKENE